MCSLVASRLLPWILHFVRMTNEFEDTFQRVYSPVS